MKAILGALCILVGIPATAWGAGDPAWCNKDLLQDAARSSLPTRYQVRASGSYCEGIVSRPNAGALELVGFYQGRLATDTTSPIRFALPDAVRRYIAGKGDVLLEAGDWGGAYNYRLDGNLRNGDLLIDANQVLVPLKVDRSKLGVVAWVRSSGLKEYLPVRLSKDPSGYVVVLVSPVPLKKIFAKLLVRGTSQALQADFVQQDILERTPVSIPIAPTSGKPATLKIVSWDYDRVDPVDWLVLDLHVPVAP